MFHHAFFVAEQACGVGFLVVVICVVVVVVVVVVVFLMGVLLGGGGAWGGKTRNQREILDPWVGQV